MQNKKKELDNMEQDPNTPIALVYSLDFLTESEPDNMNASAIRTDIGKLVDVLDLDNEARDMAQDIMYYADTGATQDVRRLWNRFKILYGPDMGDGEDGFLTKQGHDELQMVRKAIP